MLKPGTYCVAVSGGVDSVALLHMLIQAHSNDSHGFVVAHFDHGTRPDSASDAEFVQGLATQYDLACEVKREELGKDVSEEYARERRYEFLKSAAKKHHATLITAHHADDIVETITINMVRGTGWRGLAAMGSQNVLRPLVHTRKQEILQYAKQNMLSWREDSTNATDKYLRNRLRAQLAALSDDALWQLVALRDHQIATKQQVETEAGHLIGAAPYQRYLFIMCNDAAAMELLRAACVAVGYSPLASQLWRGVLAIKTAKAGSRHDIGGGLRLEFTRAEFIVKPA